MKFGKTDRTAEMETFLSVAQAGSLSAAARELELTPSAVSRIMTRIEKRLGVRLIVRSTRSLRLTSEGESYALAARRILKDLDDTETTIANRGSPSGNIKVSTATAHSRLTIVPLLKEFLQRYPDITIEIDVTDQISDVSAGHVDVAIRFGQLPDSGLHARRLGETGRVVIASPEYLKKAGTPQSPADLKKHNCLDFSFRRLEPGWPFRENGQSYLLSVSGNIIANNGETLVELARQGMGITRVGRFHVEQDLESGLLVPLLEAYNPQDREAIHAVYIGGKNVPARIRVFVDYLVEKMTNQTENFSYS
ncbi:LysR family transcriptional regulator [Methylophaga pinxianii]|uniref:LysR family transcriptional regulator n=1 Tax=Methylophaga pinxianii TaxID=2881052 RepID=UPI001CF51053|nr:LysR family transcriptional regulator [Methylophaga pinxianii]MCB2426355.1 LysR family transcriptional regulator [Methylophaga pinxianii]UPH46852.1 LysR family transcriptional regulator [Methylophaga pinxianii]